MNAVAQLNRSSKTLPVTANAAIQQDQQQGLPSPAIRVQMRDSLARITISGRFDFQMRSNFKNSYLPLLDIAAIQEIWVDLSKVDYLDSSAMGMLLLLDERAKAADKPVALLTIPGVVSQVLEIANFSKIFNIKHSGAESRGLPGRLSVIANNAPYTC